MKQLETVEIARSELHEMFENSSGMMARIGQFNCKEMQVAHALLTGLTISNHNYEVGADIEMTRADGVIGALRRNYDLPIDHIFVDGVNEAGTDVVRCKYLIVNGHIEQLNSSPEALFKKYRKMYAINKIIHENNDIARIIERYGKAGALRRVVKQAFKGSALESSDTAFSKIITKEMNRNITFACEALEMADGMVTVHHSMEESE